MAKLINPPSKEEFEKNYFSFSIPELQKIYHVGNKLIHKWAKENGLEKRPKSIRPTKEELFNYIKTHQVKEAIAHFGLSKSSIQRWIKEYDLTNIEKNYEFPLERKGANKITSEEFIKRIIEIHGNIYDYSKLNYKGYRKKILIGCKIHGFFSVRPDVHLRGGGCDKCNREKARKSTTHENTKDRKPQGYWKDIKNIRKEIEISFPRLAEEKILPTLDMLIRAGIRVKWFNLKTVAIAIDYKMATRWITRDNHFVISFAELALDEFLFSRSIKHEPEVRIGKYYCDQKVGDYYIEIWGYPKKGKSNWVKRYNEKRKRKELYYKENKLNLIEIEGSVIVSKGIEEIEKYLSSLFASLGFDISKKHEYSWNTFLEVKAFRPQHHPKTLQSLQLSICEKS